MSEALQTTNCINDLIVIPIEDLEEFSRLPRTEQELVNAFQNGLLQLDKLTNPKGKNYSISRASKIVSRSLKDRQGSAPNTLRTLYRNWLCAGRDWRFLVNGNKVKPVDPVKYPQEFLDHVGFLFEENQRKCRPAYRKLLRAWNAGQKIPGYGTWRDYWTNVDSANVSLTHCPPDLPPGWSYANIMRIAQPPKVELAMARVGTAAAMEFLPPIPGTRQGVRFMEFIFFDDVYRDREIIVSGYPRPARLLQLGALDYATGYYMKFGLRPELAVDDGARERLKERDMKWLVTMLLEEYGFPADYPTHLICERGTATLRDADAKALYELSEGRIRVCYTSMLGQLVLSWQESKDGNSNGKGPLESWHNLFHNEDASEPGQIGKDWDHSPAALDAKRLEAVNLQRVSNYLTPQQRASLKFPFHHLDEALHSTIQTLARINTRTDHELEGFETVAEWRPAGTLEKWRPESHLALMPASALNFVEWNTRLEMPLERKERLSHGVRFLRFPDGILARFYEDSHINAVVEEDGSIVFKHEGKRYVFVRQCDQAALPRGFKVLVYFNPQDLSRVFITDAGKGGYVATWKRWLVHRGNAEEVSDLIGQKTHFLNEARTNVRRRGEDKLIERAADLDNNARILTEAGLLSGYPFTAQPGAPLSDTACADVSAVTESQTIPAMEPGSHALPTDGSEFHKGRSLDAHIGAELQRRRKAKDAQREKLGSDAATGAALARNSNGVQTEQRSGKLGIAVLTAQHAIPSHKEAVNDDGKRCPNRKRKGGGSID